MTALNPEIRELLTAIREALDLPYGVTGNDSQQRQWLLGDNAIRVVGALERLLDHDAPMPTTTRVLRELLAENPVTYATKDKEAGR